jgi:opacity protein-like surface antigen
MLRHWIAAAAALISAFAGPAIAHAQTSWTGVYGGVNAFASRDKVDASGDLLVTQISNLFVTGRGLVVVPGTTLPLAASGHKTGLDWGGQLGFQWQTGRVVLGIEGDFDPSHHDVTASQTQSLPPTALTPSTTIAAERDVRVSRQWSIRARLGYAISSNTLAYATGGYANARLSVFGTDTFTNPGGPAATCAPSPCQTNLGPEGPNTTTDSNARANAGGWRAGLGVDQRLTRHFSIGLEYLHSDFGTRDITFHSSVTSFAGTFTRGDNGATGTHGQVNTASTRVSLSSDAIGMRLNFRF